MPKFRKKPVVIEAHQYQGNIIPMGDFFDGKIMSEFIGGRGPYVLIYTLEGNMTCSAGDWIIRGVNGEYYPCKPDIFEKTYEPADAPAIPQREKGEKYDTVYVECPADEENDYTMTIRKEGCIRIKEIEGPVEVVPAESSPIPQSENKIEGEPMDGYAGNTILAIKCVHCGEPNQIYKNGLFRKNCWYCKEPLEDGERIALRVNDAWQSPAPEPEATDNQEGECPQCAYVRHGAAEMQKYLTDQNKALEAELAEIHRTYEKEPYQFLLVNALRLLSNEQMKMLADALYDRIPKPEAGENQELVPENTDGWYERLKRELLSARSQRDALQAEISSLKELLANKEVPIDWEAKAEIELLRKNETGFRPETSILIARMKKTEGRFVEGDIVELIPGLIDVDYYRIHNPPPGNESAKFAYSSVDIIGARCPGLTPHQQEDRLKAHAIAFVMWVVKNASAFHWATTVTQFYEKYTADEANNLHKPISE